MLYLDRGAISPLAHPAHRNSEPSGRSIPTVLISVHQARAWVWNKKWRRHHRSRINRTTSNAEVMVAVIFWAGWNCANTGVETTSMATIDRTVVSFTFPFLELLN